MASAVLHSTVALGELMNRHTGPALLVRADEVLHTNDKARLLLIDDHWWPLLSDWLSHKNTHQSNRMKTRIGHPTALSAYAPGSKIELLVIEWEALPTDDIHWLLLGRDATLENNLTHALGESRQRFKDLLELSTDYVWETDHAGRFDYVSDTGLLGWNNSEIIGRRPHELGLVATDALTTPFLTQTPIKDAELWLKNKTGELRCLQVSARPRQDATNAWIGARGICRDITAQHQHESQLAAARMRERIVRYIVRIIRDDLSPEREFAAATRALTLAMSAEGSAIFRRRGEDCEIISHYGGEVPSAAKVLCRATLNRGDALQLDGEGHEWLICRTQHNRIANGALAIWRKPRGHSWTPDENKLIESVAEQLGIVWEQLRMHEQLQERADKDGLTKLTNQRAFADAVRQRMERHSRGCVLINIDLDNFKVINDQLGHNVGDDVLRRVAALLEHSVRPGDIPARVGGDEFLLWLERTDEAGAQTVATRIIEGVQEIGHTLPELPKKLGASIGIAAVHETDTYTSLLQRADATMYKAKHSGKGRAETAS